MKKTITTLVAIIIIHISVNCQPLNDLYVKDYHVALFGKVVKAIYNTDKKDLKPIDSLNERNLVVIKKNEIIINQEIYKIIEIESDEYFHSTVNAKVFDNWYECINSSGDTYLMNAILNKTNIYYFSLAKEKDSIEKIEENRYTHY
jgi:hypothetical protein